MRLYDYKIEKDIKVFYIEAKSFPMGIKDAFDNLYSLLSGDKQRNFYGISSPQHNKGIIYKACAEQLKEDEAEMLGLKLMVIPKGVYYCVELSNFRMNPMIISETFETILSQPNIDPAGFCLEIYGQDTEVVKCLVKKTIR